MTRTAYQYLRSKKDEVNSMLDSLPNLRGVLDEAFFTKVGGQIDEMEKRKISGPIHPMFLFLHHAGEREYEEVKLLEKYLGEIFNRPDVNKREKRHLAKELALNGHLFRLFEISIVGNLLSRLPVDRVEPYPITIGKKRVDVSVMLVDRPVFIEVTMLGESDADRSERESSMYSGQSMEGGSLDMDADADRFASKILEEAGQFAPQNPNVVIVQVFDFRPMIYAIQQAVKQNHFPNVGLIVLFDRERLTHIFTEGCDESCGVREDELDALKKLLSPPTFSPLVFGTVTNYPPFEPTRS